MVPTAQLHSGYDEVAPKRVKREVVELGGRLNEAANTANWLADELREPTCLELLERITHSIADAHEDLSRLMCEAKKQMRKDGQ
jgi:hypothetical protein